MWAENSIIFMYIYYQEVKTAANNILPLLTLDKNVLQIPRDFQNCRCIKLYISVVEVKFFTIVFSQSSIVLSKSYDKQKNSLVRAKHNVIMSSLVLPFELIQVTRYFKINFLFNETLLA